MELFSNIENELTQELQKIYNKKFSKSAITFRKGCFGNDTIFVDLYLAQNEHELTNGYKENDMFNISFRIKVLTSGEYLFENLSKSYNIKPQEKWLAYSHTDLSFRKVKGTTEKVAQSFEKFVDRLEIALKEDIKADLIHDEFKDLLQQKMERN